MKSRIFSSHTKKILKSGEFQPLDFSSLPEKQILLRHQEHEKFIVEVAEIFINIKKDFHFERWDASFYKMVERVKNLLNFKHYRYLKTFLENKASWSNLDFNKYLVKYLGYYLKQRKNIKEEEKNMEELQKIQEEKNKKYFEQQRLVEALRLGLDNPNDLDDLLLYT